MRDTACVINFEKQNVWVIPLITDSCINCNHVSCAKRGSPFLATNSQNLPLTCGDVVRVSASTKNQIIQGLWSILFPLIIAIVGYFIASHFSVDKTAFSAEGIKALGVLLGLAVSVYIVLIVNKFFIKLAKPEITAVVSSKSKNNDKTLNTDC